MGCGVAKPRPRRSDAPSGDGLPCKPGQEEKLSHKCASEIEPQDDTRPRGMVGFIRRYTGRRTPTHRLNTHVAEQTVKVEEEVAEEEHHRILMHPRKRAKIDAWVAAVEEQRDRFAEFPPTPRAALAQIGSPHLSSGGMERVRSPTSSLSRISSVIERRENAPLTEHLRGARTQTRASLRSSNVGGSACDRSLDGSNAPDMQVSEDGRMHSNLSLSSSSASAGGTPASGGGMRVRASAAPDSSQNAVGRFGSSGAPGSLRTPGRRSQVSAPSPLHGAARDLDPSHHRHSAAGLRRDGGSGGSGGVGNPRGDADPAPHRDGPAAEGPGAWAAPAIGAVPAATGAVGTFPLTSPSAPDSRGTPGAPSLPPSRNPTTGAERPGAPPPRTAAPDSNSGTGGLSSTGPRAPHTGSVTVESVTTVHLNADSCPPSSLGGSQRTAGGGGSGAPLAAPGGREKESPQRQGGSGPPLDATAGAATAGDTLGSVEAELLRLGPPT